MLKWFVAALAIVVLAVGGGVFLLHNNEPAALATKSEAPEVVPTKRTVLLIPGYGGGQSQLRLLGGKLNAAGIRWELVDVGDGQGDLNGYAGQVEQRAAELKSQGYAVDLIGYSAGGITARIAATENPDEFRRVITLSAPHEGTTLADLGAAFGECPKACQQLRTDSPLLADLEPVADKSWLSIYSNTDEVIRPAESSRLTGAVIRPIQNSCPEAVVRHGDVPTHRQTTAIVIAFLENEPLPAKCVA